MAKGYRVWAVLLIGAVAAVGSGCASTSESMSAAPVDLASLAGTWQGTGSGAQGLSQPITVVINAGGTYTATGGVFTSQGSAQIKEGKLVLTSGGTTGGATSGGQAANQVLTAVLSERKEPSQVVQVLTGSGVGSTGPVSFVISRPKH